MKRWRGWRSDTAHDPRAPLLALEDVGVDYEDRPALEGISFTLEAGQRLAVVGPNGAGKTTLLRVIAGLERPSRGQVRVYGHRPGRHVCIAYVPQRSQVDWSFPVTVAEVVLMGRLGQIGLLRRPSAADRRLVREALAALELSALAHRPLGELSGGQQQRVFIARALAQEAELLLLDEPLSGLDVPTQREILEIFDLLARRGVTVVAALHDLDLAAGHFDRVLLLHRRLVAFGRPEEVFTPARLAAAYDLPVDPGGAP